MTTKILFSGCYHCGSYYEITNEVMGISENDNLDIKQSKFADFLYNEKKCLNCGKIYMPTKRFSRSNRFILQALCRTKG